MEPEEAIDTSAAPIARNGQDMPQDQAPAAPQMEGVPTGDDNSPGVPNAGQGDNGAIGEQQPGQTKRFGPLARIASYLMGEGAVPAQVLQQAAHQIDPQGQMSPSDRNVMVVEDAAKRGGQETAWKIVQANRVAYNAKQSFAYAALNGNQQKPGSVAAAVDAANQAAEHVLDGSNAHFMVSQGGQITATVKGADGGPAKIYDLTQDQFRKYLNVGGAGQWDRLMQPDGTNKTLSSLSAENQQQQRDAAVAKRGASMKAPDDEARQGAQDPSTTRQGQFRMTSPGEEQYDDSLQRKAWGMFPGAGSSKERAEWMASQQSNTDTIKGRLDVAEANAEGRQNVAAANAGARRDVASTQGETARAVADTKAKGWQYASDQKLKAAQAQIAQKLAHEANTNANSAQTRALKLVQTKLMTAQTLSKEEQAMVDTLPGAAQASAQVTKPQQAPDQQQAPQQQSSAAPAAPGKPPVEGARFYKGQWYTRGANGEAVPYQQ